METILIERFKLTQLFKIGKGDTDIGGSIEHRPEEKVDCLIEMSQESKIGLWNYCNVHKWNEGKIETVRFEGYYSDGVTPINPVIIHVDL